MGVGGDGGSNDGGEMDLIEAVLTCEGNITDPELPGKLLSLVNHLKTITHCDADWVLKSVQPWNSVKVTFSIPREAAVRLQQLAQAGDAALRQLGILSVQVDGDQIVSLKVAGPNNETTEILIRTEGSGAASGNTVGHNIRPIAQAACGSNLVSLSNFGHSQSHPTPQFRSPGLSPTDGVCVTTRPAVIQQRSPSQNFPFPIHSRQVRPQAALHQAPTTLLVSGVSQSRPTPVVARQVFHNNPPPPYPSQENLTRQVPNSLSQIPGVSQINGQFNVNQSSTPNTLPQSSVHSQQASIAHTVAGNFRVTGSSVTVSSNAMQTSKASSRAQVNMVKNSPLLVGLLQQPDQTIPVVSARSSKGAPVQTTLASNTTALASVNTENGPIPSAVNATIAGGTFVGRSRDGLTTHQLFSGGSVITNSLPNLRQAGPVNVQHHSQVLPNLNSRLQHGVESRRVFVGSSQNFINSSHFSSLKSSVSSPASVIASSHPRILNNDEMTSQVSGSSSKKESQYLINPNTGLLEPRPSTDSSDSETECMTTPLHDDHNSLSLPSDEESNLGVSSRKQIDHSDSVNNIEARKMKLREPDSSPVSWENSVISSNSGEKIKLKLKLGKEQVAQTTIVGNTKKPDRKEGFMAASGSSLQSIVEPRVPKLHIKLHSSQPVIVKSIEETDALGRKIPEKDTGKDDKGKRKASRNKLKSEKDFELLRGKNSMLKSCKDRGSEEITSQVLKMIDGKRNLDDCSRVAKRLQSDNKIARLLEENKLSLFKSSGKIDKSRTRLKNTAIRKVGDLSSVGEIASHKILETLPPSITKIAAMHTQQPHRNPSPIPSPSYSTGSSMFGSSNIPSVPFTATTTTTAFSASPNDHCKSGDLDKCKNDSNPDPEQCPDALTKLRVNSPPFQSLINGDLSNNEKLGLACRSRNKGGSSTESATPPNKFGTIKMKGPEDIHSLDSLKKDLPEGLGTVSKFLNSSVQINKVSSEKVPQNSALLASLGEEMTDKFKKLENVKAPLMNELAGLKSNSDITIHSVSKNELLSLNKANEAERRLDSTIKPKAELKVGRVTCVDVTDRQALEEALKTSRNSSKKCDSNSMNNTTMVVDRLMRSNSIYSSNSVPFSSNSQTISESTNLYSMAVKTDTKEVGCSGSELQSTVLPPLENVKSENCIPQQLNLLSTVDNNDCDNRNNISLKVNEQESYSSLDNIEKNNRVRSPDLSIKDEPPLTSESHTQNCPTHVPESPSNILSGDVNSGNLPESVPKISEQPPKAQELNATSLIKPDVDSPEGTPKGEHGNGQGGEDSGIESMDALSEKSPNHSDQSPNRREDKETDVFQEKLKKEAKELQDKQEINASKKELDYELSKNENKNDKTYDECEKDSSDVKSLLDHYENISDSKVDEYLKFDDKDTTILDNKSINDAFLSKESSETCTIDNLNTLNCQEDFPQDASTETTPTSQNCQFPQSNLDDKSFYQLLDNSKENEIAVSKDTATDPVSSASSTNAGNEKTQPELSESIMASCSSSIALTTISLSTTSPTSSTISTQSTSSIQSYISSIPVSSSYNIKASSESILVNCTASPKSAVLPISTKPSLLAITLSRPPGTNLMNSQYASSLANNPDQSINTTLPLSSDFNLSLADEEKVESTEAPVDYICQNVPNKGGFLSTDNCATASATTTPMIILAASTPTVSTTTCLGTVNSNKVVSLKPNSVQTASVPIAPPVGKTFRLVAINSVNSTSSSVKGQLVTLKPVVGNNSVTKNAQTNSSISPKSAESSSSRPNSSTEVFSPLQSNTTDDLDFVGFSTAPNSTTTPSETNIEKQPVCVPQTSNCPEIKTAELDPAPLRLNPPLYTYGNRERKKEFDGEVEDKEKEDLKKANLTKECTTIKSPLHVGAKEENLDNPIIHEENNMDALTIEIPPVETFHDEKRLTRTTRQSARLASPKVNSPGSELSPKLEKKSPAGSLVAGKPSPVGLVKSSLSPALRVAKRRRHESESSNASSVCEDSQDPPSKLPKKKHSEKGALLISKDDLKPRSSRGREGDSDKVLESSDEDSLPADDISKKATTEEEEDESRPCSRTGRTLIKTTTRTRERPSSAESSSKESPTSVRRTSRLTKSSAPSQDKSTGELLEKDQTLVVTSREESNEEVDQEKDSDKKEKFAAEFKKSNLSSNIKDNSLKSTAMKDAAKDRGSPAASIKGKRELENDLDKSAASRRKTRSATNTTSEDLLKRRRLSKDK